jgi:hypothetical protein
MANFRLGQEKYKLSVFFLVIPESKKSLWNEKAMSKGHRIQGQFEHLNK